MRIYRTIDPEGYEPTYSATLTEAVKEALCCGRLDEVIIQLIDVPVNRVNFLASLNGQLPKPTCTWGFTWEGDLVKRDA